MSVEATKPSIWKKKWPAWLLVLIVTCLCVGLFAFKLMGQRQNAMVTHAKQNTRALGYALVNFENDYGTYPNEETAEKLKDEQPSQAEILGSESSNDCLRQLMIAGYVDVDSPFKAGSEIEREEWLGSGECKYAYVIWDEVPHLEAPLLIWPVEVGDKKLNAAYNGKAVILMPNYSVKIFKIQGDFFDWSQPHWGGQNPKIVWPE